MNPYDDGVARAREDLPDSLFQVGLNVANEPGVAVHRVLDSSHGLVIVDRRIDADPVLGEIDPIRLVCQHGLTDVGAGVANAWNSQELGTGSLCDPDHFRM